MEVAMTSDDRDHTSDAQGREPEANVLHVVAGYSGYHLVTPETLDAASEAQSTADATPYYANFGELRRLGELDALGERLRNWDLSVEAYISVIERSAGRVPDGDDLSERLAAVGDVDFGGDDEANAPSDSDDFRASWEIENEVEDHYMHTIAQGMCSDVPADILDAFGTLIAPMFVEHEMVEVEAERLDDMIEALEARSFVVIRD